MSIGQGRVDLATGWRHAPFWSLFRRVKRTGHPDAELLSVYREYGVIRKRDRDDNYNKPSEDLATYQVVDRGDLVINKMKSWQGSVGISDYTGIVSPAYFVFRKLGKDDPRFLNYLLRSGVYAGLFMSISKGIRVNQWDLDPDKLRTLPLMLPSFSGQRVIAKFLDRETARIDAMIEAQRVLTSRIDERRLAIITEMVTGETGSRGSERQPGSEWIGEIPTHWEVAQVRRLGDLHTGSTPVGEESALFSDDSADTPWVRPENLGSRQVSGRGLGEEGLRQLRCVPAGSVLICGIGATVSKVGQSDRPVATNQQITAWVHDLDPAFAYYAMMAAKPGLLAATVGNTLPILNNLRLGGVTIPLPPLAEQVAIGSKLDDVTRVMDDMIEAANDAIALMRERRSALISAAVTGRIDPRTGQESRPEMVLEPV